MRHPLAELIRHQDPDSPTGWSDGPSQEKFAKDLNISQSLVSRFLSGRLQRFKPEIAAEIEKQTGGKVPAISLVLHTPYFLRQPPKKVEEKPNKGKGKRGGKR